MIRKADIRARGYLEIERLTHKGLKPAEFVEAVLSVIRDNDKRIAEFKKGVAAREAEGIARKTAAGANPAKPAIDTPTGDS